MAFEDHMPHEIAPRRPRQHGIYQSTEPGRGAAAQEAGTGALLAHKRAQYRTIFRAMKVPGLPEGLKIGAVEISQTEGPVWTQRTEIRQSPGWRPVYYKKMRRFPVGDGEHLTVCTLALRLGADLTSYDLERWHFEARAAIGILAAVLDERVAQEQLGEDLIIFDQQGVPVAAADHAVRVREFPPTSRMLAAQRKAAAGLAQFDLSRSDPIYAASRWYLRAAQEGPTADAVVAFWIVLEALSKPPYGTKLSGAQSRRSDVDWVELAIREVGTDPSEVEPSVGRLAGLRAEVVHGGVEHPKLLRDGFYTLEALTRQLIRDRLGVWTGWPLRPDQSNLKEPLRRLAGHLQQRYKTTRWSSMK